ncbi:hypothetical protein NC653_029224 [Populus alba x Populus x berolinensis]|uniref:MrfA-like Zn-binding domain-containing protein n=1 Tax=Populus alba x Populus x berolinensis TaxID=444605 RepID=A0AAD6M1X0_9ROSI|nr:hypothetical protein NC653_029224 [Populus alba x Populus x berolinensis]
MAVTNGFVCLCPHFSFDLYLAFLFLVMFLRFHLAFGFLMIHDSFSYSCIFVFVFFVSLICIQAVWIPVPQSIKELVEEKQFSIRGGLRAASHALLNVVPLYLRCNSSDLAPECPNPHDSRYFPGRILVYDQHPGGTGVSMQTQPYFPGLLNAALELLTCCHCSGDTGCPNCVQSMVCHEYNEVIIHKDAAIMIIEDVLDAESFFGEANDSS